MTTLVIHGTLAQGASWAVSSWGDTGFLTGVVQGFDAVDAPDDVWRINGRDITEYRGLAQFQWSGSHEGTGRGDAAAQLASYLNDVADLTDEPIRVIAHSHGCNVFKLATSLPQLAPQVRIDRAVFLACPHFYEDDFEHDGTTGWQALMRGDLSQGYRRSGYLFRYPLDPDRVGRILNLYTEADAIQCRIAKLLGSTTPPLSGSLLANFGTLWRAGGAERPEAAREDMDANVAHLYENCALHLRGRCSGFRAHSTVHGMEVGSLCGIWLGSGMSIRQIARDIGLPDLSCDDTGD